MRRDRRGSEAGEGSRAKWRGWAGLGGEMTNKHVEIIGQLI